MCKELVTGCGLLLRYEKKNCISYMLPEYGNVASILKLEEPLTYACPVNLQQPDTISLQEQF